MIAFASCVGRPDMYAACAARGIAHVCETDSVVAEVTTDCSIFEAYNEVLDHFATVDDLEAVVLLHEDTVLLAEDFCDRVRAALADPEIAVVGAVGARGVSSLAWWEGRLAGRAAESRGVVDGGFGDPEVDAVDGLLMVLSPWAVRNLRFDADSYTGFHGYDVDFCFQARAAGRRVIVADLPLFHHTKGGLGDRDAFFDSERAFAQKWAVAA